MLHEADILKLAPQYGEAASDKSQTSQTVRGRYSGIQRKITCVLECVRGEVDHDHNGRRRHRQAVKSLVYFAGLLHDAKRDNEYMQSMLRKGDGWLSSALRMCKAYSRKALFWNRGNYLDAPLPDFYADGMEVLGVDGNATLEEVLAAFRAYIEPQMTSNPPSEVASEVLEEREDKPVDGIKPSAKGKDFVLTYPEYQSIKRIVRPSDLRLAAGRLAGYKKRGDLEGFLNTLHQIHEGRRLSVGGNRSGANGKKRRVGFAGRVMGAALVGAGSALEVAARVSEFLATGSLDGII